MRHTDHDLGFKNSHIPLCFYLLFKTERTDLITSRSLHHRGEESRGAVLPCCGDGGRGDHRRWGLVAHCTAITAVQSLGRNQGNSKD